jgi:ABC-type thiamine transport system ATPase subunit
MGMDDALGPSSSPIRDLILRCWPSSDWPTRRPVCRLRSSDPETVDEVLNVTKRLAVESITMVVVTHEMSFARRGANRVVVFEKGQVVEQGLPAQISTLR